MIIPSRNQNFYVEKKGNCRKYTLQKYPYRNWTFCMDKSELLKIDLAELSVKESEFFYGQKVHYQKWTLQETPCGQETSWMGKMQIAEKGLCKDIREEKNRTF